MQCALNCKYLLPSSTSQYSSLSIEVHREFKILFVHLQSFLSTDIKINKSIAPAFVSQLLNTEVTEIRKEMQLGSGLPKSTGQLYWVLAQAHVDQEIEHSRYLSILFHRKATIFKD